MHKRLKRCAYVLLLLTITGCAKKYTQEDVIGQAVAGEVTVVDSWEESGQKYVTVLSDDNDLVTILWDEKTGATRSYSPSIVSTNGEWVGYEEQLKPALQKVAAEHRGCKVIDVVAVSEDMIQLNIDNEVNILPIVGDPEEDGLYVEDWNPNELSGTLTVLIAEGVELERPYDVDLARVLRRHCLKYDIASEVLVTSVDGESCVLSIDGVIRAFQFSYTQESQDVLDISMFDSGHDGMVFTKDMVILPYLEKIEVEGSVEYITYHDGFGVCMVSTDSGEFPLWFDNRGSVITGLYSLSWSTESEEQELFDAMLRRYLSAKGISGDIVVTLVGVDYVELVVNGQELHLKCAVGENTPVSEDAVLFMRDAEWQELQSNLMKSTNKERIAE